jgi:hypothetical protein
LEERRELIEKGGRAREEKGKGQGVTGKMLFFFLPPDPEQRRGQDGLGRRRAAAPQGSAAAGGREKRRGRQGGSIPLPTLGCDGVQRRISGGGGEEWCRLWAAAQGRLGEESEMAVVRRITRRGPFIVAGKAVTRPAPCSWATCDRQWWRKRFGKDLAWTRPAGFEAEE